MMCMYIYIYIYIYIYMYVFIIMPATVNYIQNIVVFDPAIRQNAAHVYEHTDTLSVRYGDPTTQGP